MFHWWDFSIQIGEPGSTSFDFVQPGFAFPLQKGCQFKGVPLTDDKLVKVFHIQQQQADRGEDIEEWL